MTYEYFHVGQALNDPLLRIVEEMLWEVLVDDKLSEILFDYLFSFQSCLIFNFWCTIVAGRKASYVLRSFLRNIVGVLLT